MSALAAMPTAIHDVPVAVATRPFDTAQLMRDVISLRGTSRPAPDAMLDALSTRGMWRLAEVLRARNLRLDAAS